MNCAMMLTAISGTVCDLILIPTGHCTRAFSSAVAIFFWMFWSITIHSLPGDYFPPRAVASVYGIGGTGSTLGSVISTWAVGRTLDVTHSYAPVFIGIGLLMPIALLLGMSLMGRVEPVKDF